MRLETPAQASAAVAVLIMGADRIGTMEEGRYLYEEISALPVFGHMERSEFTSLLDATTEWLWSTFPNDGGRITEAGLSDLLGHIAGALPEAMREDVLRAAMGLARSDGMNPDEKLLLGRLCDGLGVDPLSLVNAEPPA